MGMKQFSEVKAGYGEIAYTLLAAFAAPGGRKKPLTCAAPFIVSLPLGLQANLDISALWGLVVD